MPVELFKAVFDWATVILAALTFVALAGALITGNILGDRQAEQLRRFDNNLTAAKLELSKQQERAAQAELESEKLKQVVAWRVISPESGAELERILSAKPGAVNLRYTDGDPEALFLAIQISKILGKAKWKVAPGSEKFANAIQFGIALPDSAGEDAKTLRSAFVAAKISFSTNPLPPAGASFSVSTIPGAPTLMVGSRAPALP